MPGGSIGRKASLSKSKCSAIGLPFCGSPSSRFRLLMGGCGGGCGFWGMCILERSAEKLGGSKWESREHCCCWFLLPILGRPMNLVDEIKI